MSMTLYEITERYSNLAALMDDDTIDQEMISAALGDVEDEFDTKSDNIACLIKNLLSEAAAIKTEEKALMERRKSKERHVENLKNYLSNEMQMIGKNRIETARNVLSLRKSARVVILDEQAVQVAAPSACTLVQETKIDKRVLKQLLETSEVSGAMIEERENLQVK